MNCNAVREALPHYIDDMLSEIQVEMVEEHLALCDECKAVLNDLKKLRSILEVVPELYAPDGFDARLRKALQETPQETSVDRFTDEIRINMPEDLHELDDFGHPDFLKNGNIMAASECMEPMDTPPVLEEMEVKPLEFENVDEDFLPAAPVKKQKDFKWKKITALVAVLVVGLISILTFNQEPEVPLEYSQNDQAMMAIMEKAIAVPSMTWDSARGTEKEEAYYHELLIIAAGEGSEITESYRDAEGLWHFKVVTDGSEREYNGRDGEIWIKE